MHHSKVEILRALFVVTDPEAGADLHASGTRCGWLYDVDRPCGPVRFPGFFDSAAVDESARVM